jgi:hypothetical protein
MRSLCLMLTAENLNLKILCWWKGLMLWRSMLTAENLRSRAGCLTSTLESLTLTSRSLMLAQNLTMTAT